MFPVVQLFQQPQFPPQEEQPSLLAQPQPDVLQRLHPHVLQPQGAQALQAGVVSAVVQPQLFQQGEVVFVWPQVRELQWHLLISYASVTWWCGSTAILCGGGGKVRATKKTRQSAGPMGA